MTPAVVMRQLTKTYAGGRQALRGLDLTVEAGDFYGLLGPNGAGKSTALGILTSLVRKDSGQVTVLGVDLDRHPHGVKATLGLVPQETNFNGFEPALEIVLNQAGYYGVPRRIAQRRARFYLGQLDLWQRRHQLARRLSGGLKRRLMIARALVHQPQVLVLDEPTAGVDLEARHFLWDYLRELNAGGTTVILTTHYLEEAEGLCRNIGIIDQGSLVAHRDTATLVRELHTETFVLDLQQALIEAPTLAGYRVRLTGAATLEVDVGRDQSLNDVFARLSAAGIQVASLRNKANRLETLFMFLIRETT